MIILLIGNDKSGKSTIADYLYRKHKYQVFSLGDPLKNACAEIYGEIDHFYEPDLKDKKHPNSNAISRDILKAIAEEARFFDPAIFGRICAEQMTALKEQDPDVNMAVDDLRDTEDLNELKTKFPLLKVVKIAKGEDKDFDISPQNVAYTINSDYSPAIFDKVEQMLKYFKEDR